MTHLLLGQKRCVQGTWIISRQLLFRESSSALWGLCQIVVLNGMAMTFIGARCSVSTNGYSTKRQTEMLSFPQRINTHGPNRSSKQSWEKSPWLSAQEYSRRLAGKNLPTLYDSCTRELQRTLETNSLAFSCIDKEAEQLFPRLHGSLVRTGALGPELGDFSLYLLTFLILCPQYNVNRFVNISGVITNELFRSRRHVNSWKIYLHIQHVQLHPHQAVLLGKHLDSVDVAEVG